MKSLNIKSIIMGFMHSIIIPFIIIAISRNLFLGLAYYVIPAFAYETFASKKGKGKAVFYTLSIFICLIVFISLFGDI